MDEIKESITESIKYFRSRMDVSQEELSSMCGYSSTYIGKIERGQRSPSLDTLIRIAEALQIPVASLLDPYYRDRREPDEGEANGFSPYDATLRRFNYLVGRLAPDGTVRRMTHLPWFQSELPEDGPPEIYLWELEFMNLSDSLVERIQELLDDIEREGPGHISPRIAGYDFLEEPTDFVLVPKPRDGESLESVHFELFYPRVVRGGESVPLEELHFELNR